MNRHLLDDTIKKINSNDNKPLDTLITEKANTTNNLIQLDFDKLNNLLFVEEFVCEPADYNQTLLNKEVSGGSLTPLYVCSFTAPATGKVNVRANLKNGNTDTVILMIMAEDSEVSVVNISRRSNTYGYASNSFDIKQGYSYNFYLHSGSNYGAYCNHVEIGYAITDEKLKFVVGSIKKIMRGSSTSSTVSLPSPVKPEKCFISVSNSAVLTSFTRGEFTVTSSGTGTLGTFDWQIIEYY